MPKYAVCFRYAAGSLWLAENSAKEQHKNLKNKQQQMQHFARINKPKFAGL